MGDAGSARPSASIRRDKSAGIRIISNEINHLTEKGVHRQNPGRPSVSGWLPAAANQVRQERNDTLAGNFASAAKIVPERHTVLGAPLACCTAKHTLPSSGRVSAHCFLGTFPPLTFGGAKSSAVFFVLEGAMLSR
jgi:hypothetical protein